MNPHSGMIYELAVKGDAQDPPAFGATIPAAAAVSEGMIDLGELDEARRIDLEDLIERGGKLVSVDEPVVQKLRLGERELRRRRQRR